jgi:hypothetical protein
MNAPAVRRLQLHPGINFSCLEVGGDLGGCVFALGSVLVLVAGLPQVRWFVGFALVAAVPTACVLMAWHRCRERAPSLWNPIDLDLGRSPHQRSDEPTEARRGT